LYLSVSIQFVYFGLKFIHKIENFIADSRSNFHNNKCPSLINTQPVNSSNKFSSELN